MTDPGIVSAGHAGRVTKLLEAAGLTVACFDAVEENPSTLCVEKCVKVARHASVDAIVGLGGGSSMDTAKGCNFILTNGGPNGSTTTALFYIFEQGFVQFNTGLADAMGVILFLISLGIIIVQVGFFGRGARRDV